MPFKAAAMDIGYISLSLGRWSYGEFMAIIAFFTPLEETGRFAKVMCSSSDEAINGALIWSR